MRNGNLRAKQACRNLPPYLFRPVPDEDKRVNAAGISPPLVFLRRWYSSAACIPPPLVFLRRWYSSAAGIPPPRRNNLASIDAKICANKYLPTFFPALKSFLRNVTAVVYGLNWLAPAHLEFIFVNDLMKGSPEPTSPPPLKVGIQRGYMRYVPRATACYTRVRANAFIFSYWEFSSLKSITGSMNDFAFIG